MKWLKRSGSAASSKAAAAPVVYARLVTNAPSEWPAAALPADPPGVSPEGFDAYVAEGVRATLAAAGLGHEVTGLHKLMLTPDGVLAIPFEVRAPDGTRHPVFPYHSASPEMAAHWSGVRTALERLTRVRPVFFAPADLDDVDVVPARVTHAFDADALAPWDEDKPRVPLATWWATPDDPDARDSPTFRDLARAQTALEGCASHVLGALVERLANAPRKGRRFALPDAPLVLHARAPDDQLVAFSASAAKGVRVHFDPARTPPWWRDRFIKHWAAFVERTREDLVARRKPLDADAPFVDWWKDAHAAAKAPGKLVERFGVVAPKEREDASG